MDPSALRNFKDFLLQYNKISETCFVDCVNDLSARELTQYEGLCVEKCAAKYIKTNNKAMQVYVEVQPAITQKRIEEMNKQAEATKISQEKADNTVENIDGINPHAEEIKSSEEGADDTAVQNIDSISDPER